MLRARWGSDGARIIADTSAAKIWLPGISDPEALETASMLCGTAAMREHGEDWTSRYPVMTPDMIRQLPATRALVIRGGCSPVIARLRMAWNDPLYRQARRISQVTAALTPAPEPEPERWAGRPGAPGDAMPGSLSAVADADESPSPGPTTGYPWDENSDLWMRGPWDDEAGAA